MAECTQNIQATALYSYLMLLGCIAQFKIQLPSLCTENVNKLENI